ncbi:MAG TPA: hypothetical protein VNC40_07155 [Gaiellaceae bacterium]|nr:hypothetical protein [Gaiellaceae bacterium]
MAPTTGTDEPYAFAMDDLWSGLARTLARLDVAAADPERLDSVDATASLRRLQYSLHLAAEHAYGIAPLPAAASAHAELAAALTCARDATADVADAVSVWGADGAAALVHEWRGALFRVRLARMRLAMSTRHPPAEVESFDRRLGPPLLAFALALFGALAFAAGATLQLWPLWSAGLVAACSAIFAYRP